MVKSCHLTVSARPNLYLQKPFSFPHPTAPTKTLLQALPRWQGQPSAETQPLWCAGALLTHTLIFWSLQLRSNIHCTLQLGYNAISRQTKANLPLLLSCETSGLDLCWLQFNFQPSNQDPFPSTLNILQWNFFTLQWSFFMELPSGTFLPYLWVLKQSLTLQTLPWDRSCKSCSSDSTASRQELPRLGNTLVLPMESVCGGLYVATLSSLLWSWLVQADWSTVFYVLAELLTEKAKSLKIKQKNAVVLYYSILALKNVAVLF